MRKEWEGLVREFQEVWQGGRGGMRAELSLRLGIMVWIYGASGALMVAVALVGALLGSSPLLILAALPSLLVAGLAAWGRSLLRRRRRTRAALEKDGLPGE